MDNNGDKHTEQDKLESFIEDLELDDKSEVEIERVVSALSQEGMALRKERKSVRYQLYRLKSEAEGRAANISEEGFREIFEAQTFFDGWRNFSITWDVALDDPHRIVHRVRSVGEEWDELVKAKFPTILPGGKVVYPDISVRKKVEDYEKNQAKKDNGDS